MKNRKVPVGGTVSAEPLKAGGDETDKLLQVLFKMIL